MNPTILADDKLELLLSPFVIGEALDAYAQTAQLKKMARVVESAVIRELAATPAKPSAYMYDAEYSSGSYSPPHTETRVTFGPVTAGSNIRPLYKANLLPAARAKALVADRELTWQDRAGWNWTEKGLRVKT